MGCRKAVLKRKFIVINTYIKKRSRINTETLLFKELDKEKQTKPTTSNRKELVKFKAEINKIQKQ